MSDPEEDEEEQKALSNKMVIVTGLLVLVISAALGFWLDLQWLKLKLWILGE